MCRYISEAVHARSLRRYRGASDPRVLDGHLTRLASHDGIG